MMPIDPRQFGYLNKLIMTAALLTLLIGLLLRQIRFISLMYFKIDDWAANVSNYVIRSLNIKKIILFTGMLLLFTLLVRCGTADPISPDVTANELTESSPPEQTRARDVCIYQVSFNTFGFLFMVDCTDALGAIIPNGQANKKVFMPYLTETGIDSGSPNAGTHNI